MKNIKTYRTLSIALAALFFIFNIGLPFIVASCPMPKQAGQKMCAMCPNPSNSNGQRLTTVKNTSCCATVIAADRNTNVFLKVNTDAVKITTALISHVDVSLLNDLTSEFCFNNFSSSPPLARDIPILNSSLLI